ncbi:MAG: LysM peptidoglycan-binding domain-containing protein [Chloroflexota bacterium]
MQPLHTTRLKRARVNQPRERWRLLGFAALMLLSGMGLDGIGGAPRLPDGPPRPDQLVGILGGSTLPAQALALVLVDLAWLMWGWIVASMGLELLVMAAEALAQGAAWALLLRRFVDRLSFPLARRAVAAAFAVQILSRGVPLAAAQPLTPADVALVAEADRQSTPVAGVAAADTVAEPAVATYSVQAGDTLWSIAQQAYGNGAAYRRLVDANVGRRMSDGHVFGAQGVIRPGWELVVPDPDLRLRIEDVDGQRWYTVEAGDTLSGVAAEILGDDAQWRALFELNRGAASSDGKHLLTNPHVIWPGLRLRLPPTSTGSIEEVEPVASDLVAASTASLLSAQSVEASIALPDDQSKLPPQAQIDPPSLVRMLQVAEPIALEPAGHLEPVPSSVASDAESSPADQEGTLPEPPRLHAIALAPAAIGGLGVVAMAGIALGARRRRRLRPLPHQPESEVVVEGGFAEAQLAPDFTRGLHGADLDPVVAIVEHLQQFLDEHNLTHVKIAALRHGRSATTLTLSAGLAEQTILIDLAATFAARLEAESEVWVSPDQDVMYRLRRVRKTRLLPAADATAQSPCLVPLGVLYDRQEYLATCTSLGHVLIASLPGHGADTIVTSLVATLTARRSPEQLRVWIIAHPRGLAAPVFDFPHVVRTVDPGDDGGLSLAAEDLQAELDRRAPDEAGADLVVVVPELASLGDQAARFELLASRSASLGVRFIAATSSPEEAMRSPLLSHFGTRMVLRMENDEASVALLGVADAAFLGGGGRLLLRLDGREPVELYGYHVATEHLERLVRVMRSAYPSGPGAPPTPVPPMPATRPQDYQALTEHTPQPESSAPPRPQSVAGPAGAAGCPSGPGAPPEPVPPLPATPQDDQALAEHAPKAESYELPSLQFVAGSNGAVAESARSSGPLPEPVARATPDSSESAQTLADDGPPIRVICFGGPRVLCAGEQVWPRRSGGEAKPWEFLLYLACQPAAGVSSEDAVEALWPEDEEAADAAHRFRQLRYRLRHALATVSGAPASDGICLDRGTLRVDPTIVYSDAQEFLELVRRARISPGPGAIPHLERARNLYQGDLLEGPDARRYAWLDERADSGVTLREHFRRQFEQTSTRLAELYASSGDLEASIDLYRELTEIDASDERLWRALFRLHADRGDRLALVREERRLRAALRYLAAEMDDAGSSQIENPSRETLQEYQRLLASLQDREREATAV